MDCLQVFLLKLKEVLPVCLMMSISIWLIYFAIRLLKNMFCYRGYSVFSNPFEDIAEKIQEINLKKSNENQKKDIVIPENIPEEMQEIMKQHRTYCDKPYKINLSKDKSGE